MMSSQEREHDIMNLLELEAQTHKAMTPMIDAHISTSGNQVCDLGYDRDRYNYQRLEVAHTPASDDLFGIPIEAIPSRVVMGGIQVTLAWHLRSLRKARKMPRTFQETQAFEGSNYSIAEDIEQRLQNSEAVACINEHLIRGDLRDVAIIGGGLGIAIGKKWVRDKSVVFMGKNISREGYGKRRKPKVEQITQGLGVIWVMQNTSNRKDLDIAQEAVKIVNEAAADAIDNLRQDGLLAFIVPAGSTTLLKSDTDGVYYHRPPTRSSVSTLARFNAILDVAIKGGEIMPGQIHTAEDSAEMSDRDKILNRLEMVDSALVSLAIKNAEITGIPLVFQRVNKQWNSAEPSGAVSVTTRGLT